MVLQALKRFFKHNQESSTEKPTRDLTKFVEYVVQGLVDNPDQVNVEMHEQDGTATINISCQKEDVGKVIGRKGRTISAIRSLVSDAAVHSQYKRTRVDIMD